MDKKAIAASLEKIAGFLQLKGDNAFRVRAFQNSARAVAHFSGDIATGLASGELARVDGVGKATIEIVTELVTTGQSTVLAELEAETPRGLVEMLRISGLGVAKIRLIHETLGIDNLDDLEQAAADGRLARLPRFGARTAANILRGISYLRRSREYRLFHHARAEAEALRAALEAMAGVTEAAIAGDVRRRCDVVSGLAFVLNMSGSSESIVDDLGTIDGVIEFHTPSPRTVTLKFGSGAAADVTLSDPIRWGFDMVSATGSTSHVEALRTRAEALGLGWDNDGMALNGATVPCRNEQALYEALSLPYIPPEMRENTGEIEVALEGKLPNLLEAGDLRGFLHCHTDYSDGSSTVEQWAEECEKAGYEYLGITDHSVSATYAGGLGVGDIARQHAEIDDANKKFNSIRVLKGVEADILSDGRPDYSPEVRATFDFIIASVHNRFNNSKDEMTDRILRTMDDPSVSIIGHPTGRMLLGRDPYPMDIDAVFQKAVECGVAIEINSDPQRLDLDWKNVRKAITAGVTLSIGADAHSTAGISNVDLGVGVARKGWVTRSVVLNARPLEAFLDHAGARR